MWARVYHLSMCGWPVAFWVFGVTRRWFLILSLGLVVCGCFGGRQALGQGWGGGGLCTLKHMGNLSRCDLLVTGGPGGGGSVLSLVPAPDDLWGDYCGNSIGGSLLFCPVAAMVVVLWSLLPNEGWGCH